VPNDIFVLSLSLHFTHWKL